MRVGFSGGAKKFTKGVRKCTYELAEGVQTIQYIHKN